MLFCAILLPSTALSAIFPVAIVFAAISAVVTLAATIFAAVTVLFAIALAVPVTSPSISATRVAFAYPVPDVLTVVVGSAWLSLNSFHLPESPASLNNPPYKSCEPLVSYNP